MARTRQEDWIVCACKPNWEVKAARNLYMQHIEYYLPRFYDPMLQRQRMLFPGYIFTRPHGSFIPLTGTRGISCIIRFGEELATVKHREVQRIKDQENQNGMVVLPQVMLIEGEPVLITGGRYKDQIGLYQGMDNFARIKVLFEMLGRPVRVTVDRKLARPTTNIA
jgi:transcription antitermination factor NusG